MHKRTSAVVGAAEGYRLWSKSYDLEPNPLLGLEMRTLADRLDSLAGKVLLDVACGTGRWMAAAAERGAHAFGLDLSGEMLDVARPKPRLAGRLVQGNACSLPFLDHSVDAAICSFALGYLEDPDALFRELSRVTRRRGIVIVSDLHPQALQAGWLRTFRHSSDLFEIESHIYTYPQCLAAGLEANLVIREVLEPHFGEPEHLIMKSAGKEELIETTSSVPAILVMTWERL